MRLKLISCEAFCREMAAASARSPNHVEVEFLPVLLQKNGCADKRHLLQSVIDDASRSKFQAVLLGYGLCRSELAGLKASSIPIVIPRQGDCLAQAFQQEGAFSKSLQLNPSFHFHASHTGARTPRSLAQSQDLLTTSDHWDCGLEHLAANYGDEVAQYFSREFRPQSQAGSTGFFPGIGRVGVRPSHRIRALKTVPMSDPRSSRFERSLLQELVDGYWSYEHFLVVPPGWQVVRNLQEGITAVPQTP